MVRTEVDVAAGAVATAVTHLLAATLPALVVCRVFDERRLTCQTLGRSLARAVSACHVTGPTRVEIVVAVQTLIAGIDAAILCECEPWYTCATLVITLSAALYTRGMAGLAGVTGTLEEARTAGMNTLLFLIDEPRGTRQTGLGPRSVAALTYVITGQTGRTICIERFRAVRKTRVLLEQELGMTGGAGGSSRSVTFRTGVVAGDTL